MSDETLSKSEPDKKSTETPPTTTEILARIYETSQTILGTTDAPAQQ